MDLTLGKNHCPNYFQEQKQLNLLHTHAHTHNPRGTGRVKFFQAKVLEQRSPGFLAPGASVLEDHFSMDCRHREHDLGMIQVHSTYCVLYYYYYISYTSDHQALDPRGWRPWCLKVTLFVSRPFV